MECSASNLSLKSINTKQRTETIQEPTRVKHLPVCWHGITQAQETSIKKSATYVEFF